MDREERTKATSVKIPEGLLSRIEEDIISSGDFSSRNDYIIAALRQYEAYRIKLLAERKGIKFSENGEINLDTGKIKMFGEQKFE